MANAGRILIIPRGDYDANSTYDKLDLVKYKGTSWLAKKNATGIEPSKENDEYWQNMFDISISNKLTTWDEGYVLDARQGKVLSDSMIWNKLVRDTDFTLHANIGMQYAYASKTRYLVKLSLCFVPVEDIPIESEIVLFTGITFKDQNIPVPILTMETGGKSSYGLALYNSIVTYGTLLSGIPYVIDCIIPIL